jgi:PAS domain S-box-containing protein
MNTLFLNEHRCKCGKLLLKGIFFDGTLEIKCKKCGSINKIGSIKLIDDSAHYSLLINNKGIIADASDLACRILGYVRDELVGKYFTQINSSIPKEIGKKFFGPESVLMEDNHFKLDTVHQSKDGKKIPVTVFLKLYQPNKEEIYILLLAELKNDVNNSKIFLKDALDFFDNACDFYFDIDRNGIGEYVSPSVEKLFGFSSESVIGKNYFDFTPPETREEFRKMFQHFSANALPFRIENKAGLNNERKIIRNELYFTPQFNDYGKFIGYRVLGWMLENP